MPSGTFARDYKSLSNSLLGHRLTVDAYSLHLVNVVGVGAFGVIFAADEYDGCVATSRQFAVKVLIRPSASQRRSSSSSASSDRFITREKTLHPRVSHPNVVKVHAVIEQMDLVYIVMDYYPEGDLFKAIVDRQEFVGQDDKLRDAFLQICYGVKACHQQGVFHRDIKPENVLIRSNGGGVPQLALADFGLATNEEYTAEFGVGSSYYMSLECGSAGDKHGVRQFSYSSRSNDVWSLGVLLINFACGRNPWVRAHPEEQTFAAFMRHPDYLLSILPLSVPANDLLKRVFRLDPAERIGLDAFIQGVKTIERFTMDWTELLLTTDTVRHAAGTLMDVREQEAYELQLLGARGQAAPGPYTYSPTQVEPPELVFPSLPHSGPYTEDLDGWAVQEDVLEDDSMEGDDWTDADSEEYDEDAYDDAPAAPEPVYHQYQLQQAAASTPSLFQPRPYMPDFRSTPHLSLPPPARQYPIFAAPQPTQPQWSPDASYSSPSSTDCGSLPSTPAPLTPAQHVNAGFASPVVVGSEKHQQQYMSYSHPGYAVSPSGHALGLYQIADGGQLSDLSTFQKASPYPPHWPRPSAQYPYYPHHPHAAYMFGVDHPQQHQMYSHHQ